MGHQSNVKTDTEVVIGVFYERPDGVVVRVNGCRNVPSVAGTVAMRISYYTDDFPVKTGNVDEATFRTWKRRKDLNDFPNAKDPRLPYVFDLFWDIKYTSELKHALRHGHDDLDEIKEAMQTHGISISIQSKQAKPAKPKPRHA